MITHPSDQPVGTPRGSNPVLKRPSMKVRFSTFFGPFPSPTDLEITCDRVELQITRCHLRLAKFPEWSKRPISF